MTNASIETWQPTEEEEQAFRATDATLQWLLDMPIETVREYAGQWVAARDRQIIAKGDSFDALLTQLQGTDLQSVIIDRIEPPAWMVYR